MGWVKSAENDFSYRTSSNDREDVGSLERPARQGMSKCVSWLGRLAAHDRQHQDVHQESLESVECSPLQFGAEDERCDGPFLGDCVELGL